MARLKKKNTPLRRRSPVGPEAEDRLSSLPDDLLRRVLSRLDTRTALSTAVLSRRWARLPRDLPALRFSVYDVLPPRYFAALDRRLRARARGHGAAQDMDAKLLPYIKGCDRLAMRAFFDGIAGILDAPSGGQRRAKALYLEFFRSYDGTDIVDRMIDTAVGEWGVEHLDVVVLRTAPPREPPLPVYVFPDHLLDDERHRSRLRSLTLGHCGMLPPLHRYAALEQLVLQDTPASTPMHAYHAVFDGSCAPALRVVHLLCCRGSGDVLEIDAPCSGVEELVVESCSFRAIELRDLPELRHFACLCLGDNGPPVVELSFGTVPRLTRVIHASSPDEHQRRPIYLPPRRKFRHQQLREVCMVGFANTPRQTRFLRYLVRVCKPLERVVLIREGRIEQDGLWGWKTTVEQRDRSSMHEDMYHSYRQMTESIR